MTFNNVARGAVVLDEHHRPVEPGSGVVGRVAQSGHIPLRYHNAPEKTAETFVEVDGVRHVLPGDMATVDEEGTPATIGVRLDAAALDDLPAHASRFVRWRARRDAALHPPPHGEGRGEAAGWGSCTVAPRPAIPRPAPVARPGSRPSFEPPQGRRWKGRVWPLRPGRPPGWRAAGRHHHPVHDVLNIVHDLAFWAMEPTDTS